MADQFGAHHPKHGPRLGQIQKLNRGGLARFARAEEVSEGEIERSQGRLGAILGTGADEEGAAAPGSAGATRRLHADPDPSVEEKAKPPGRQKADMPHDAAFHKPERKPSVYEGKAGNDNRPRRVGRPRIEGVRPWEALGVSRAEYFRRRKAGKA